MRFAYLTALLAVLVAPSLASAQFFGFGFGAPVGKRGFVSFGYRGGYWGRPYYYAPVPVAYVYPAPTTVVVTPPPPPPAAIVATPAATAATGQTARITVVLPDPNAELIIQGQRMNLVGRTRTFNSQVLDPDKNYSYTITTRSNVGGQLRDETRKVPVHAGEAVTVDFSQQTERLPPAAVEPR
jgi:uncharacterized protein (TIGR03000 family)